MTLVSSVASDQTAGGEGSKRRHLHQLDALRAVAVTVVICSHYLPRVQWFGFDPLGEGAAIGVRLFFALSGFLITGILLETRARIRAGEIQPLGALARFYTRRLLRIFPLYFLVLGMCWVAGVAEVRQHPGAFVSFTYNFHLIRQGWFDANLGHFWSLSVEQQFYLAWPCLVLFAPMWAIGPAASLGIVAAAAARAYYVQHDPSGMAFWVSTLASADVLGVGALVALAVRSPKASMLAERTLRPWVIGVAILCVAAAPWWLRAIGTQLDPVPQLVRDAAELAAVAGVLFGAAREFRGIGGAALSWRPMRQIATISYGLYVYHPLMLPIAGAVLAVLPGAAGWQDGWWRAATALLLSIAAAAVSWQLLEKPLNDLKRFL
jgi:peptidoglycan/LPS O-acetylase OafA/YrhL